MTNESTAYSTAYSKAYSETETHIYAMDDKLRGALKVAEKNLINSIIQSRSLKGDGHAEHAGFELSMLLIDELEKGFDRVRRIACERVEDLAEQAGRDAGKEADEDAAFLASEEPVYYGDDDGENWGPY